jgi:uncharacterized protein (TIGR02001 family)
VTAFRATGIALFCGLAPLCVQAASEWGGTVSLVSDYVFRGVTQTRGGEALQADVHWHSDTGLLAGAWASTVDPNPGAGPTVEANFYAGVIRELAEDWVARLLAIHYAYPNDTTPFRWDYDEVAASLAFRDRIAATIAWSPNYSSFGNGEFVGDRTTVSYELSAQFPWRRHWLASAGAGYQDLDNLFGTGYVFWNCALTYSAAPWQLTLARFGTNDRAGYLYGSEATEDRWSLGLHWQFGGVAR